MIPFVIDEIVFDRLDEARVRLRMLVGRCRLHQFMGEGIDIEMALARPVNAIGPVQARVEPLRRIGRRHLHGEHVAHFVEEGLRIGFRVEIFPLPAPIGPGARKSIEDLLCRCLAGLALFLRQELERGSSATERQRKEGTFSSSTRFSCAGTPALRKYFCAITSVATCDQCSGTSIVSRRNTIEPSGLRISLTAVRNGIPA
jgi:hypothetical protein